VAGEAAASAKSLGSLILSETVVDQIRKELRPLNRHNVAPAELGQLIKSSVLRPECL
jgi:hypothetical protein